MKLVYICIAIAMLLGGCSATVKGVKQDIKESLEAVKGGIHEGAEWVGEKTK